jgi:hypothetical protein
MNARRPVPTEVQPQQTQTSAAPDTVEGASVTESERKARFRVSLAWAVEEHAGLLARLAR